MRNRLVILGLALLTLAVYAPTLAYGLVYDDHHWIPTPIPNWHAWSRAPWLLAQWVGGGLPWSYHALVVALHLVNGALLWTLARRWLSPPGAWCALLLFWLHPVQVEAVAYISGGWEVLLTTYVLIALLAGLSQRWGIVALALLAAATLKPSARPVLAVVPVALLLATGERWPLLLVGLGAAIVGPVVVSVHHLNAWTLTIGHGLAAVLVPRGLSIEHDWTPWLGVGPWVFAAFVWMGAIAWVHRERWSAPLWAWLWIVGLLLPRVLVAGAPPLTEHHLYLPFIAIWLLAGSAVDRWAGVTHVA